jgi:hypothetical protein
MFGLHAGYCEVGIASDASRRCEASQVLDIAYAI